MKMKYLCQGPKTSMNNIHALFKAWALNFRLDGLCKNPACLRVKKGKWSAFRKIAFAIYLRLMRFNSCWWIWENRIAGMEASTVILCSSFPRTLIKVIEWMHGKTRCCCCGDSPKIRCELQTRCQINFVQPTYSELGDEKYKNLELRANLHLIYKTFPSITNVKTFTFSF